jgi:single-strand DNA-binding protein
VVVSGRLDQRSWENQEGEKRSKIEITADEIAPSLRWATVDITKNERRSPDGSGSGGPSGNNSMAHSRAVANEPPAGHQPNDEEPF